MAVLTFEPVVRAIFQHRISEVMRLGHEKLKRKELTRQPVRRYGRSKLLPERKTRCLVVTSPEILTGTARWRKAGGWCCFSAEPNLSWMVGMAPKEAAAELNRRQAAYHWAPARNPFPKTTNSAGTRNLCPQEFRTGPYGKRDGSVAVATRRPTSLMIASVSAHGYALRQHGVEPLRSRQNTHQWSSQPGMK